MAPEQSRRDILKTLGLAGIGLSVANLPEFVGYLKQLRYDGVVSLHSEYKGDSSFRKLSTAELVRQSAADLRYVRSLFGR